MSGLRSAAVAATAVVATGLIAGCGGTTKTVVAASANTGRLAISGVSLTAAQPLSAASPWPGPTSSPKPQPGKKVFILSCTNAGNAQDVALGAAAAARAAGWTAKIGYGQLNPTVESSAITSAVTQGFQGIVTVCVTPSQVPSALKLAQSRHIPVIDSADIPDPGPLVSGPTPIQFAYDGNLIGQWIINSSHGHAKVVVIRTDDLPGNALRDNAVVAKLETCSGCKIIAQPHLTVADALTPKIASLISALNSQYGSEMQYLVVPFGDAWPVVGPAIAALHRHNLKVETYDGGAPEMEGCKQGLLQADAATDFSWLGWSAIDQLNRVMHGLSPSSKDNGPAFLVTSTDCARVPPGQPAGALVTDNFQAKFRSLWGKS